jgi:hypothetical protein
MKNNAKKDNRVLRVVERIARNEVEKVRCGWPPICLGIGHQPKRPKRKANKNLIW